LASGFLKFLESKILIFNNIMFVQNIQLEFFTASFNLSITYCEGKSFSMMRGSIREAPLH
ncbi:MAG: hypothetical protein AAFP08_15900, partial [Bacteroidota bacterium]